jgi:hypothetical protein
MPVSHQLGCIFVHIPRTGGTSIETALGVSSDARVENTSLMFGRIASPALKSRALSTDFLQHLTASELRDLLGDEFKDYFRFAFVRNPWERMVSVYFYHRKVTGQTMSFHEFLKWGEDHQRNHLVPQHEFVVDKDGNLLVDFVGRFERMSEDFSKVCAALKIERELPHLNAATIGDYRSCYNDATREIVDRIYGEDIERFNYAF